MVTAGQVMGLLHELAPPSLAEGWDRIGLQVGDPGWPVQRVLVSLGPSAAVVREAVERDCQMIVCHHPLIFRPLSAVRLDEPAGAVIGQALEARIALGVVHTNLDRAPGGLNDWLAEVLGLGDPVPLAEAAGLPQPWEGVAAMGRVGMLEQPLPLEAWAREVARRLGVPAVRYVGGPDVPVQRVACVGGSGADAIGPAARARVDCLVTGDVKFHDALEALDRGVAVVDGGHFGTEVLMRERLARWLEEAAQRRGWRLSACAAAREADPFAFAGAEGALA